MSQPKGNVTYRRRQLASEISTVPSRDGPTKNPGRRRPNYIPVAHGFAPHRLVWLHKQCSSGIECELHPQGPAGFCGQGPASRVGAWPGCGRARFGPHPWLNGSGSSGHLGLVDSAQAGKYEAKMNVVDPPGSRRKSRHPGAVSRDWLGAGGPHLR
ncbi:hypothetical protein MAPG_03127 [Magnaporthiopsis poae ATCC 64411]|uniref:Uncharacterized protein n=1 Tax=Magnaporthiopsis poae (strain ATCC 64411 / 73-15) TaxID=644358 RepID=A0A0C4DT68_MAGP6|nr:hypothetical protein MAPG_03127 [Magnaporthiopsis poae ATCC 64411]